MAGHLPLVTDWPDRRLDSYLLTEPTMIDLHGHGPAEVSHFDWLDNKMPSAFWLDFLTHLEPRVVTLSSFIPDASL